MLLRKNAARAAILLVFVLAIPFLVSACGPGQPFENEELY